MKAAINAAVSGDEVIIASGTYLESLTITNNICITTGNGVRQIGLPVIPGATLTISNNIVQGGFPGIANRNVNPGFIDPTGATSKNQLAHDSAAIDAGNNNALLTDATGTPTLDLARNDRRIDAPQIDDSGLGIAPSVDIGAYEFRPAPTTPCPADRNTNGAADIGDIFDFLNGWFASAPSADFNTSSTVTLQDLFDFLSAYFAGCP